MTEYRRINRLEQSKKNADSKFQNKSKQSKNKYHFIKRSAYLADPQTSDCTKSSTDLKSLRSKGFEETVRDLQRENQKLKNQIVLLKTEQFMKVNEQKLKDLIQENEELKKEIIQHSKSMEQLYLENQLLQLKYGNLQAECNKLRQQIKYFKNKIKSQLHTKQQKSQSSNSDIDHICRSIYRNASTKVLISRSKQSSFKERQNLQDDMNWRDDYFYTKVKRKEKLKSKSKINN